MTVHSPQTMNTEHQHKWKAVGELEVGWSTVYYCDECEARKLVTPDWTAVMDASLAAVKGRRSDEDG